MASILYKWFFLSVFTASLTGDLPHPIFVSVVEVEHNARAKTLEVSCKLFTDDFEKTLRNAYKSPVDLINPKDKAAMDRLINDYVQKHFRITADNRGVTLKFLGYEQEDEAVYSYFEAENVTQPKSIQIVNNLLYEYKPEQMGLLHVTVNGTRQSTKLINPADRAELKF